MKAPFIHETAVVDMPCTVGKDTKIWHFCHLMAGCAIGSNCSLGQNVYVAATVEIGNNVRIQNNVSVYDGVTIQDDVFLGPSMVFTNVSMPRATIDKKKKYEKTLVKKGATIGANATIVCGNTVGKHAFVGAGAVVTKEIPDHALVMGNPATIQGWMCRCGHKLNDAKVCLQCGTTYGQRL